MKRILISVLIAFLCACLFACSSSQAFTTGTTAAANEPAGKIDISGNFDKVSAHIESVVDVSGMTVVTDDEDSEYLYRTWMNEDGNNQAAFSKEVVIDGKTIVIGETKAKDLPGLGFQVVKISDTVGPNEVAGITIQKNGKECILTLEPNETDQPIAIDDCRVFEFTGTFTEFVIPFSYMGLSDQSTLKDIIELLGIPNDVIRANSDESGTYIELSYLNESQEGSWMTSDSLTLSLGYWPDSDTSRLSSVRLYRVVYQPYTEDSEPEA